MSERLGAERLLEMVLAGTPDRVVETLAGAGHRCAVVTNKPEGLARLLLEQLAMTRFFAAVVGGDTLAVCKPHAEPLRHALGAIASPDAAALMIGDSAIDAQAARTAGMPFLLYEGGYEADACRDEQIAACFAAFDRLPAIVGELGSH